MKYIEKRQEPLHCGNLKGDWFDERLLVSPLDKTCETQFAFTADGYIQAFQTTNQAALITIEKLGLNRISQAFHKRFDRHRWTSVRV